jgi:hypothetical protein
MRYCWNGNPQRNAEVLEGIPASLPLCPPHVLHGPTKLGLHSAICGGKPATESLKAYMGLQVSLLTHKTETRGHRLSELGLNLRFQISSCSQQYAFYRSLYCDQEKIHRSD